MVPDRYDDGFSSHDATPCERGEKLGPGLSPALFLCVRLACHQWQKQRRSGLPAELEDVLKHRVDERVS